jgi:hypothetical protein
VSNNLFHIEPVQEVIETVLFTGCLRNETPTSIIIVGPSGVGKSMMLSRYESEALHHTDSVSSKGLYDIANMDQKGLLKFLLIPDFNPTLSRKSSTVQSTISNLLSFTSDGTVRIDDGRDQKHCKHEPVGIVTAATEDIYSQQAKKWYALGLRRRIIPIFFRYNRMTIDALQTLVGKGKIHSSQPDKLKIKLSIKALPSMPDTAFDFIKNLSLQFAMLLGKLYVYEDRIKQWHVREVIPVSPQITLTNLARAHALRDNRAMVKQDDLDFLLRFISFCDPEHPREI